MTREEAIEELKRILSNIKFVDGTFEDFGGEEVEIVITCPNCNSYFDLIEFAQKDYHCCPNCGTKMREE